jgi:hypothetical protein
MIDEVDSSVATYSHKKPLAIPTRSKNILTLLTITEDHSTSALARRRMPIQSLDPVETREISLQTEGCNKNCALSQADSYP